MILDVGERGSGKSTRAIDWAADNDKRLIVTFHEASCRYLQDEAKSRGIEVKVMSWAKYMGGGLRGTRDIEVYIDEVALCLSSLGGRVVGMSGLQ